MPKTELWMRSYEAINMSKKIRDLGKKTGSTLIFGSGSGNTVPEDRRRSQKGLENTIASM